MIRRRVHPRRRGRSLPTGAVLLYHRIASSTVDPWDLAVSPDHFREHLEVLGAHHRFEDLGSLLEDHARGRPPVAVTFDDGYVDNLRVALPALEQSGAPATFFAVAGDIVEFWWDRLARIILRPGSRPGHHPVLDETHLSLWTRLQSMPAPERDAALTALEAHFDGSGPPESSSRRMTAEELAFLAAHPLATLGAHTVTHPVLARLDRAEQRAEIAGSVRMLSEISGAPVTRFSYPFGGPRDFTSTSRGLARDAGLELACSNQAGLVSPRTDRFCVPRLYVRDIDGETFEQWLAGSFAK